MGTYVIKRLLLMIPTFAAISLMVFVVLNFAPGTPGAQMQTGENKGSQDASSTGDQAESYRLFKEQFNLDKPVLLNTRYSLERTDVEAQLSAALNLSGSVGQGRRIEAQEFLENWGRYAVPGLIAVVTDEHAPVELRAMASQRLTFNAQIQNKLIYKRGLTSEERAEVKRIATNNSEFRAWSFAKDDPSERQAEVTGQWTEWYQENAHDFKFDIGDKAAVLFLDTRFAKYWANLARLDFGVSHVDKRPVLQKVFSKLKYSITLSLSTLLLIYGISVPLGIWSSVQQNSLADRIVTTILFMLYSLPSFFTAVRT